MLIGEEVKLGDVIERLLEDEVLAVARGLNRLAILILLVRIVTPKLQDSVGAIHVVLTLVEVDAHYRYSRVNIFACHGFILL